MLSSAVAENGWIYCGITNILKKEIIGNSLLFLLCVSGDPAMTEEPLEEIVSEE